MKQIQIAVFEVGDMCCGIETEFIKTIIRYENVEKKPKASDYIEGVTQWRDIVIPVVNLNNKLSKINSVPQKRTGIIIVRTNYGEIGFMVDHVQEIKNFQEYEIEPTPKVINELGISAIKSIAKMEDKLISIIDFNNVFTKSEAVEIDKIRH